MTSPGESATPRWTITVDAGGFARGIGDVSDVVPPSSHWRAVEVVPAEDYDRLREALRTIAGPEDRGPWIMVYRDAGGGYEGLQAIARVALDE
jgi:hypothetical protein